MERLEIQRLYQTAILPTRGTPNSAGLDLYACLYGPILLRPGGRVQITTGIALQLPKGTVGLVYGRSSLGLHYGITLSNGVGVIDEDYRGEIIVGLTNHSQESYSVCHGDRIAQLVITPILAPEVWEVSELSPTERGTGGLGSTGK